MEKRTITKGAIIVLVLAVVLFAGLKFTGYAISEEETFVDVTRYPIINDTSRTMKNVMLTVISSENVLAIEEVLIGEGCSVLEYDIIPEIDIVNFNSNLNLWVIGNRSDSLVLNLSYSIPIECDINISAGTVYTLDSETVIPAADSDDSGNGGTSGSGGTPSSGSGTTIPQNVSS